MKISEQRKRIDRALTDLICEQPFFATLALKLEIIETDSIKTFATDGKRLLYNPAFAESLKGRELGTVLAHEALHCAMGHIWRPPVEADHKVWNLAIDNETNWELESCNIRARAQSLIDPFPWPECGKVMEDRFKGWSAERIYPVLMAEHQKQQGKGNGKGQPDGEGFGQVIPCQQGDKDELRQEWEQTVVQAVKATREQGTIPGAIEELFEKLTSTKLDWKNILRDALYEVAKEDWNFMRPSTRYPESEFVFPSLYNEKVGKLVFAVDTSGSISSALLAEFRAEAQNALDTLNPESLTVIYCDSKIQNVAEYTPGDIIPEKVVGRGGTDFRPVFEHCGKLEDLPKVLVYLTDLEGAFPAEEPEYKTIWIATDGRVTAPFGEVIQV